MSKINNSLRGSGEFGLNPASRLWKPLRIGTQLVQHRVGLTPLTRMRSPAHLPDAKLMSEYYSQRSHAGLLVSEATLISLEAGGYPNVPGIYTKQHVAEWKKITDAVHAKGGVIYCQLWALGRANAGYEKEVKVVSSGDLPFEGGRKPEALSIQDIERYLKAYAHAATCALEAGFDGCELHGANGYLPDQFLQASCNNRTDGYGGSLENRARFMLEAIKAVSDVVGEQRTAIRISPFSAFQGMGQETDPYETWGYVCKQLVKRHPKLAYVSLVDPRLEEAAGGSNASKLLSSDPFRAIFRGIDPATVSTLQSESTTVFPEPTPAHPTAIMSAGGYTPSDAEPTCDRTGDIVGYGRIFIANPDLPHRLKHGLEMNAYSRNTFYTPGAAGYTDYPAANESTKRFVPKPKAAKM